jgi:hypothetical protein
MKHISLLLLPLLLAACGPKHIEDVKADELPQGAAFLVLDAEITFDGAPHSLCSIGAMDTQETMNQKNLAAWNKEPRLSILSVKPGKYSIQTINCLAFKGLWNKQRLQRFEPPLVVNVESGTITYPGTVVGDWNSEDMHLGDVLFNNGGLWAGDEGTLALKREDRSTEVKSVIEQKNPEWIKKFRFVTRSFENNPRIVQ